MAKQRLPGRLVYVYKLHQRYCMSKKPHKVRHCLSRQPYRRKVPSVFNEISGMEILVHIVR
jgi:hypothetical protein